MEDVGYRSLLRITTKYLHRLPCEMEGVSIEAIAELIAVIEMNPEFYNDGLG